MEKDRFYLQEYELTLHSKSFLVFVLQLTNVPSHQDRLSDLPEWVFHSPNAIWLNGESSGNLFQRANEGERIKEELRNGFAKNLFLTQPNQSKIVRDGYAVH